MFRRSRMDTCRAPIPGAQVPQPYQTACVPAPRDGVVSLHPVAQHQPGISGTPAIDERNVPAALGGGVKGSLAAKPLEAPSAITTHHRLDKIPPAVVDVADYSALNNPQSASAGYRFFYCIRHQPPLAYPPYTIKANY